MWPYEINKMIHNIKEKFYDEHDIINELYILTLKNNIEYMAYKTGMYSFNYWQSNNEGMIFAINNLIEQSEKYELGDIKEFEFDSKRIVGIMYY